MSGAAATALALLTASAIALGVTIYPPALVGRQGEVHHLMAVTLFWAMSAGFVRGVGFIPQQRVVRWLLSGWACLVALLLFLLQRGLSA